MSFVRELNTQLTLKNNEKIDRILREPSWVNLFSLLADPHRLDPLAGVNTSCCAVSGRPGFVGSAVK